MADEANEAMALRVQAGDSEAVAEIMTADFGGCGFCIL